jgi:Zn-dependent M28 family amino/carboxypeptidase
MRRLFLASGLFAAGACFAAWRLMIHMPGESYREAPPPLDEDLTLLREQLHRHVQKLAGDFGERNLRRYPQLMQAARYIEEELTAAGYPVTRQEYEARGHAFYNIEAEATGAIHPEEIILVGAHYDSVPGSPGAGDNASGVAALLAIARRMSGEQPARTLRFVAFANEEMPYFQSLDMGSSVYARRSRARNENIVAMLSLETIGFYSDTPGSQRYPAPFGVIYPDEGNFIGVIGNVASRPLVHQVIAAFRRRASFPSEGGALPGDVSGVGWSDQWSFWEEGYPAVMITDTAVFRYPYYHSPEDTPDKLNYDAMAHVVDGVQAAIVELAHGK